VARCVDFDAGVWNAGPTCMANAAHANAAPTPAPTPAPTSPTRRRRYFGITRRRRAKKKKLKTKMVLGCDGVASAAVTKIKKQCKPTTKADNTACKPFAESLAEYY